MGFEIIKNRNQGYPSIPELNERESAGLIQPVCRYLFYSGNEGYPVIADVPESSTGFADTLPECLMVCFGENINSGYPWIRNISALRSVTESTLYYGGRRVTGMYYNGNSCGTAFCNGGIVFDTYSVRERIV